MCKNKVSMVLNLGSNNLLFLIHFCSQELDTVELALLTPADKVKA